MVVPRLIRLILQIPIGVMTIKSLMSFRQGNITFHDKECADFYVCALFICFIWPIATK